MTDVEHYSARTNIDQLSIREGMYEVVRTAFTLAEIPWSPDQVADRGDGMLILIPADVPKLRLFERLPDLLNDRLRAHNTRVNETTRFRLRVAIHAGEVYEDERGVAADAVNHTFRLVNAPSLKAALATASGDLALIISDWCYQEVVRHHPSAQPEAYRQVDVAVKETRTTGWVRIPGWTPSAELARPHIGRLPTEAPPTAPRRPTSTKSAVPPPDILSVLLDALLNLPSVLDDMSRRSIIEQLPPRVAAAIPYHPRPAQHVVGIVMTCFNYRGAFDELVTAIRTFEGDSLAMGQLDRTIASLATWLPS